MNTQVIIPEVDEQERHRSLSLIAIAEDYVIDAPEMRKMADDDLAIVKRQRKHLEDMRTNLKAPILEAGRKVDALFKPMIDACDVAAGIYTVKILAFDRLVAAARAAEQRIVEEAAKAQKAALEAQAAALATSGATEAAAAVQEAAALVVAPVIPLGPARGDTATDKSVTWSAEVTDLMELVTAVANGLIPLGAIEASMTYLNGRARLEKGMFVIPGVRAVPKEGLRARRSA